MVAVLALGLMATANVFSQPRRIQWQAFRFSSSNPADGVDLVPAFRRSLSPGGALDFGQAEWNVGGISCAFTTAGTTDGGTNTLTMKIIYSNSDGGSGTECSCDMGTGSCLGLGAEFRCDCGSSIVELTGDKDFYVAYGSPSGCMTNPSQGVCTVDLFR